MTPAEMAAQPIGWHVQQAAELAMRTRRTLKADLQPMMHLVLPAGQIQLVQFADIPNGQFVATGARLAVLEHKPRHAILIQEGWGVKRSLMPTRERPQVTDPDVRAVLAGALRPGKLPRHKRGEQLIVYGECADGTEAWAMYDIEGKDFVPALSSWEFAEHVSDPERSGFITRYRPLFMAEAMVRELDPLDRTTLLFELGGNEALLEACRASCLRLIASGGQVVPEQYHRDMDRAVGLMRETIGWRKR